MNTLICKVESYFVRKSVYDSIKTIFPIPIKISLDHNTIDSPSSNQGPNNTQNIQRLVIFEHTQKIAKNYTNKPYHADRP